MKYLYIGLIFALGMWLGMWVVHNDINHNCEPMGNAQGQRWLECNTVIK